MISCSIILRLCVGHRYMGKDKGINMPNHRFFLLLVAMVFSIYSTSLLAVTNQDFIGTFVGTQTSTFLCIDPNESGTVTGNWSVTSFNLNGNNYEFSGTTNATLDGSTVIFEGTATISGNTASTSGDLLFSDGTVFGNFTSTVTFLTSNTFTATTSGAFNSPGGRMFF